MEKIVRTVKPFILSYCLTVILATALLFLVSKIPQSMLAKNWEENRNVELSLNYFHLLEEGNYATYVDDYTDNIKIDIAYRLNEQSILAPAAYFIDDDFRYDYGRYWHGYCILLRPLLLFFNLNQIKILYGILLSVAFLALVFLLIKKKQYIAVISTAAAFYACNLYVTTKSLQYFNCTFLALMASVLFLYDQSIYKRWKCIVFFVIGMCVNYFDFLTFETLTLTLPLLFAELDNDEVLSKRVLNTVKCFISWLTGYAFMFGTKCLLYICVDKSAAELLKYKIVQRTVGHDSVEQYPFSETLKLTLSCVKGISFTNYGRVCLVLLAVFLVTLVIRRFCQNKVLDNGIVFFLIGLIPIIRFFVLREHSSSHFCFTYFALFVTIISTVYIGISFTVHSLRYIWGKL